MTSQESSLGSIQLHLYPTRHVGLINDLTRDEAADVGRALVSTVRAIRGTYPGAQFDFTVSEDLNGHVEILLSMSGVEDAGVSAKEISSLVGREIFLASL